METGRHARNPGHYRGRDRFHEAELPLHPHWFYNYLKGYRFNRQWVTAHQDEQGHLYVDFEGSWAETILLEVKVLAIISELYYQVTDQTSKLDYEAYTASRTAKLNDCWKPDVSLATRDPTESLVSKRKKRRSRP